MASGSINQLTDSLLSVTLEGKESLEISELEAKNPFTTSVTSLNLADDSLIYGQSSPAYEVESLEAPAESPTQDASTQLLESTSQLVMALDYGTTFTGE